MASIRSKLFASILRNTMKSRFAASGSVEKERATLSKMSGMMGSRPTGTETTLGGVPGEWQYPKSGETNKFILYLHGGGYVLGSPASHRNMVGALADISGCNAFLLDYRLGPENPFPAAVEDAVAAYKALLDEGHAAEKIFIAGDSAGGGLTVATLVSSKQQGLPMPAAGICLSPWTDLTLKSDSMTSAAMIKKDALLTPKALEWMGGLYLNGQNPEEPLASPIFADLKGLPPLLIQAGSDEVLLDDSITLDKRAKEAGVDVTLEVWDGMMHVWQAMSFLPEARQAINGIAEYMAKKL